MPSTFGFSRASENAWRRAQRATRRPRRPPRPQAPVRPKYVDPFAPLSDAQLRAKAQGLTQSELGPIIQQIRDAIEARSRSGQAAISGYTRELGNLFSQAGPQTAAAYSGAISRQGQVNSELANRLGSFGQGLGGEITGKLQAQGAPANVISDIGGGAATTAQGVANANFAKGAAETGRLISDSASGQAYAAKLPGIAGLTGLQSSKQLEAQLNHQLADQLASASSKAQDTFVSIYTHFLDQEWNKTLARQSGQFQNAKLTVDAQYKAQQIAYKKAMLAWQKASKRVDQRIRQQNANTSSSRASESARANRAREAARIQAERNKNLRQNKWQTNPDGSFKYRYNKKTRKKERIPLKGGGGGGGDGLP